MRNLVVATAAALAAGCFGGLKNESPAPRIYRVDAPAIGSGGALDAHLAIVVERTAPGLDGDGIAGRWPGRRLDYIANARWAEDVSRLLQSALVEGFQESGRLRSVQGDVGRFPATHTLVIEVRRFEADYTGGGLPVAEVALAATVGRNSDRQVLTSFIAASREGATENRQAPVVAALDAAFGRAAAELAARSFEAIAADLATAGSPRNGGGRTQDPQLSARDFEQLAGAPWNGMLTYQDYGNGREVSIPSVLIVTKSRPDGHRWVFDFRYPQEPKADTRDEYEISGDGRMLNGERIVSRYQPAPDTLNFVTEQDADDDDRPATVRRTYVVGPGRFSIRKEVRYEGTGGFLERNRYVWTR